MTLQRFLFAIAIFHGIVAALSIAFFRRWRDRDRMTRPAHRWFFGLLGEGFVFTIVVYTAALIAALAANAGLGRGIAAGPISFRLLGQALFIELPALAAFLAFRHWRTSPVWRPAILATLAIILCAVHMDAYYIEPGLLIPREYVVDRSNGAPGRESIRILHLSDIQTPSIGAHEERALRLGLSYKPDLIVMTGDYVQSALGRDTEAAAARDLAALINSLDFNAPLGVFATEGDVGPACRDVFEGTKVRCLSDESASIALPDGTVLALTGLTRGRGRERDTTSLDRVVNAISFADHRIVISHAPDFIDTLTAPIDLALAGHTHGGQVVLPLFGPPRTASRLPRKYAGGLNEYNGTAIHVSRGIGMERGFDIPVRFLCPPEIGIIDLVLPRAH